MRTSNELDKIGTALAKAQGEFPEIADTRTVNVKHKDKPTSHEYSYTGLSRSRSELSRF